MKRKLVAPTKSIKDFFPLRVRSEPTETSDASSVPMVATLEQETSSVFSTSARSTAGPQAGLSSLPVPVPEYSLSKNPFEPPAQPVTDFPYSNGRQFSSRYYENHQWIEYAVNEDSTYCFPCRHFVTATSCRKGETVGSRTFIDKGFRKWKDASALLKQHEDSERHKGAMLAWIELKKRSKFEKSTASLLNTQRSSEIEENRRHVKLLLRAIRFLGQQGLAFRGHNESDDSHNRGNFLELLNMMTDDDPQMRERLSRRYGHYCTHDYQNDLIKVFGNRIVESIVMNVKENIYFSIMADETKDSSKAEQLAVLLRYVDIKENKIKERAITVCHLKNCHAEAISNEILSVLNVHGLEMKNCVGQCYDGAKVMSGLANGVQARLREYSPHAVYFHCYAHRLNLVLVHSLGIITEANEFFATLQTLYTFISNSAPRHELFVDIQKRMNLPIRNLERTVPTRWFYWWKAVNKVLNTYQAICVVLDECEKDSAEAMGIKIQIVQSNFVFLLHAMDLILGIVYALSEQLQASTVDFFAAIKLVHSTRQELVAARSDIRFQQLSKKLDTVMGRHVTAQSRERRNKSTPSKLADYVVLDTSGRRDYNLQQIYFQILDEILNEFDRRLGEIQEEILSASKAFSKEVDCFLDFGLLQPLSNLYSSIVDAELLKRQLPLAKNHLLKLKADEGNSIMGQLKELTILPVAYSEVIKIIQIYATLPVTTAGNERFFSVMKRVKNYLRTTTGDERLSSLMLMAVEKEEIQKISIDKLVDDFAKLKERRYPLLH